MTNDELAEKIEQLETLVSKLQSELESLEYTVRKMNGYDPMDE